MLNRSLLDFSYNYFIIIKCGLGQICKKESTMSCQLNPFNQHFIQFQNNNIGS
jgi:hypothetical protein